MPSQKLRLFWLLLILLLAALLRIYHLNLYSLWIDEGFTWNFTQYENPLLILRRDVHPPLYFFAIRAWVQFAGTSVIAMRFFSVLPGMLSVAVVYQLAREIERQRGTNTLTPLIAALLMALTDAEIMLAQEVRGYTWHVLFVCLSMWGFLRWIRKDTRGSLLLWMFSTIALVYIFYLGAFIGVVQGLYALFFLNSKYSFRERYTSPLHRLIYGIGIRRIRTFVVLLICALSLIPWLMVTAGEQVDNVSRGQVILPEAYGFWAKDFLLEYFGQQWALMLCLLFFGLVIVRYDANRVRTRIDSLSVLLLLWLSVPLILFVIGNSYAPIYQPRRVSQIVPAIALLTAFGIGNLPRGLARWFTITVILIYGLVHMDFWRSVELWREMVADTSPYIAPGLPLFLELGGDEYAPRYHYAEGMPNTYDYLLDRDETPAPDANILYGLTSWRHLEKEVYDASLPALIDSYDHLWLFYWSSDDGALQWLDTFGHQRTATFTVEFNPDVYLYRYDRLPDEPIARFQNGMVLQHAQAYDNLLVDLLWTTDNLQSINYTTSAFLLDSTGVLVAQLDSQPFLNQRPTTTWTTDEVVYDPKRMQVVNHSSLAAGTYTVGVVVYTVENGEIVRVLTENGDDHLRIGTLNIGSD